MKQSFVFGIALVFLATVAIADSQSENTIATGKGPVTIHPLEHATFVMEWNGKTIAVKTHADIVNLPQEDSILNQGAGFRPFLQPVIV